MPEPSGGLHILGDYVFGKAPIQPGRSSLNGRVF